MYMWVFHCLLYQEISTSSNHRVGWWKIQVEYRCKCISVVPRDLATFRRIITLSQIVQSIMYMHSFLELAHNTSQKWCCVRRYLSQSNNSEINGAIAKYICKGNEAHVASITLARNGSHTVQAAVEEVWRLALNKVQHTKIHTLYRHRSWSCIILTSFWLKEIHNITHS